MTKLKLSAEAIKSVAKKDSTNTSVEVVTDRVITDSMAECPDLMVNGVAIETQEELIECLREHLRNAVYKRFNIVQLGSDDKPLKIQLGSVLPNGTIVEIKIKTPKVEMTASGRFENIMEYYTRTKNKIHAQYMLALGSALPHKDSFMNIL